MDKSERKEVTPTETKNANEFMEWVMAEMADGNFEVAEHDHSKPHTAVLITLGAHKSGKGIALGSIGYMSNLEPSESGSHNLMEVVDISDHPLHLGLMALHGNIEHYLNTAGREATKVLLKQHLHDMFCPACGDEEDL